MNALARTLPSRPSEHLTGRKVLAILAVFFGTVALANSVLVASALRTWSGLEEASPYQASQRYNEELRRVREQDALGWRLDASATRVTAEAATLTVTLADEGGRPLRAKVLRARFERPIDKRQDVGADLTETGDGTYAARFEPVARGQWDLVVEVEGPDGTALRRKRRIVLN